MLARIRHTLKESSRTHYCIMKSVDENVEDYEYQKVKQELQIKDLENYNIKTIMVDKYDEITGLLSEIKQKTNEQYSYFWKFYRRLWRFFTGRGK